MPRRTKARPLPLRALRALLMAAGLILAAPFLAIAYLFRARVPRHTVLEIDLEDGMVEYIPDEPLAALTARKKVVLREVVEALGRAAEDKRVHALVVRIRGGHMGLAQVEEVRGAVLQFRRSGKPAVAFAETFGEAGPGHAAYYLATAFDEIHLQPSGDVGLTGLLVESPFVKKALEKIGVEPRLDHRHEYKSAMNLFTEERFTEPHRASLESVATSLFGRIVEGISTGRRMPAEEVRAAIDDGPFYGIEALRSGLVDRLSYRDEVYDGLRERFPRARFLYHHVYLRRSGRAHRRGRTIALIYGVGSVKRGASTFSAGIAAFGGATMGSTTIAEAFRAAADDDRVAAIVFRVDSPGGSYVASDTIWRETVRARQAGKPVIVTMGNVAGSGGYFVAMDADKIVAHPSTLTGSIGVLGGKPVMGRLWERLGVTWDEVHVGRRTTMWSSVQDYTPADWERVQTWLDRIYEDFSGKVAAGRRLTPEQVDQVARGRVWTGEDAHRIGLVDELGGFSAALRLAREAAGMDADAAIRLKIFPERKSLLDRLRRDRPRSSEKAALAAVGSVLEPLRPLIEEAGRIASAGDTGELRMPVIRIR